MKDEFPVNTATSLNQFNPAVAMDTNGNFVVVWLNELKVGSANVYAQFYNAEGNPQGPELQVTVPFDLSIAPTPNCPCLAAAMDAAGNFVVAWVPSSLSDIIYARRYTIINGAPQAQGLEFPVSTSNGQSPAVAMDTSGNFVVNWLKQLGSSSSEAGWDIYARRYDKNGKALDTPEFRVNTYPADTQYSWHSTAVAMNAAGNFKIVWQSFDGDDRGIAGQRYALACRNAAFAKTPPVISNPHTDTTSTPLEAPAGIFSFIATFCNHGDDALPLSDLVSRTVTIAPPRRRLFQSPAQPSLWAKPNSYAAWRRDVTQQ